MYGSPNLMFATTMSLTLALIVIGAYLAGALISALVGRTISLTCQRAVEAVVAAIFARIEPLFRALRSLAGGVAVLVAIFKGFLHTRSAHP